MTKGNRNKSAGTWWGILGFLAVVAYVGAFAMRNYVLVDFVWVMGFSIVVGIGIAFAAAPLTRKLLDISNFALSILVGSIFFTGVLMSGFFITNMACAREDTEYKERVVVVRKYQETHHKTKRLTRKTYARGEAYQEYYLELEYPNGMKRSAMINRTSYGYVKAGDSVDVSLRKGLMGIPVVKKVEIAPTSHSSKNKNRYQRIGAKRRTRLSNAL